MRSSASLTTSAKPERKAKKKQPAGSKKNFLKSQKMGQGELQIRREPFEIETWQVDEAVFTVTEPYEKTYTVRGCFAAANTAPEGVEAPFLYVENGDPVSLSHAEGKIVLINGGANAENYEKLEKAGAVGFLILTGTPLDKDEDRLPDYRTLRGVKIRNCRAPSFIILMRWNW